VAADLPDRDEPRADAEPEDLFRYVYAERTPQLAEQWEQLSDELSATGGPVMTLTQEAPATSAPTDADHDDGGRDHAVLSPTRWRPTTASWYSARTSVRWAACSA
jgi:hypothetical protein